MGSSNLTIKTHLKSEKEIASRLKIEKDGKATEFLRNEVYRLSIPYVPRGSGRLSTDHTFPDAHTIKYTSSYAHYHYKGILYLTKSGSSWAKRGEKKFPSGKKCIIRGVVQNGTKGCYLIEKVTLFAVLRII